MNNLKSGLVAILSLAALAAGSLGLLGHTAAASPAAPAPAVVQLPEVVIAADAPAVTVDYSVWAKPAGSNTHRTAKRGTRITSSSTLCVARDLEQGGRPGAESVLSCQ